MFILTKVIVVVCLLPGVLFTTGAGFVFGVVVAAVVYYNRLARHAPARFAEVEASEDAQGERRRDPT